jgi:hemerythrin-like domain-containing protein
MVQGSNSRRDFVRNAALIAGSTFAFGSCSGRPPAANDQDGGKPSDEKEKKSGDEKEVTAAEDLMREHGVLRRVLLVYAETVIRLRRNPNEVSPDALQKTANLFRTFGEDYHEKKLEEAYIFPVVKQKGGEAAAISDILIVQHTRGREITDYILSVTNAAKIGASAGALAEVLNGFIRMYENHAATEDTIIFPAWKESVTDDQYKELSEKFEDIEHEQFGEDGFEDAVKQIGEIETSVGLADISQFTAPAPPAK